VGEFFQELFHVGLYKRSQGRIARQVTAVALAVLVGLGSWRLHGELVGLTEDVALDYGLRVALLLVYGLPIVLLLAGWWISYRLVNLPVFADFLISVEAEMNKVSWPSRSELIRSVLVVIFVIFFLATVLLSFDVVWRWILDSLWQLLSPESVVS